MSLVLLEFAKSFASNRVSAEVFSDAFIELWKIERDSGLLLGDPPALSESLSSIFCAADMYCADSEMREEYELDGEKLRAEILKLINGLEMIDRC